MRREWADLHLFAGACQRVGVEVPSPIARGIDLMANAVTQADPRPAALLELADEDVADAVTDLAVRQHNVSYPAYVLSTGMQSGVDAFSARLLVEVYDATVPLLDDIVVQLQPEFDKTAEPLAIAAQQFGFTLATTSDEVILLADEAASQAWRDAREAWSALNPLVTFRTMLSRTFDVSPTASEVGAHFTSTSDFDYSVCFAAGDNWSVDGRFYINDKPGAGLDWFALGEGGLRLNTSAEVRVKQQHKAALLGRPLSMTH